MVHLSRRWCIRTTDSETIDLRWRTLPHKSAPFNDFPVFCIGVHLAEAPDKGTGYNHKEDAMAWLVNDRAVEGRVLVVDDEEQIRKVVGTVLRKSGFDVVEAEDGAKAIEALNTGENPMMVDVIICDIRMPHVNGTEAIKYFRAQYPSVPIIVLTAYPDFQFATSMIKDGVADYLVKPVDRDKLLKAVKQAMEKRELFTT